LPFLEPVDGNLCPARIQDNAHSAGHVEAVINPAALALAETPGVKGADRGEDRVLRRQPPPNEGLVDWLLACPEKGYFVRIESESTDTL